MKIAFRVDASSKIGLGHLKRCLSLAEELRDLGADVVFVVGSSSADIGGLMEARRFAYLTLPLAERAASGVTGAEQPRTEWKVDADETVAALMSSAPYWIVVDHYSLDASWHSSVASRLSSNIAAIDDIANRKLDVSLLIDHNISVSHRSKYMGMLPLHTRILGGPRFALLGPAFRKPKRYKFHNMVRSIGVFMGGGDAGDLSSKVVTACREIAGFNGAVEVVTTRYNPNLVKLRRLMRRWPQTDIIEDLPDLAHFFARHDLQVGAGGGASLERTAVGVPSLLLVAAENQREVVSEFKAMGIAAGLAEEDGFTIEGIGKAIRDLIENVQARQSQCDRGPIIVDGLGSRRVALHLLKNEVRVRPANVDDAAMILDWRNHSSVRLMSRESTPIEPSAHAIWMKAVIADADRSLLIGHVKGVDIGVIRFDTLRPKCMEVSLYINPDFQGLGLGPFMLKRGEEYVASKYGSNLELVATVMDGNDSSRRLFESNGFQFADSRWEKRQSQLLKN